MPKLISHLLELSFGTPTRSQCLGSIILSELLGSLAHLLSCLLKLFRSLVHLLLTRILLQTLAEFIRFPKQLLLLLSEAFDLTICFFLLLHILRF